MSVENSALAAQNTKSLKSEEGSALPYLLAWLFGVPGSVLLMIFLLRAVF